MAIFPTLTPSSRTFTPGNYPNSVFAGMSGVQNRVRNSNVMLSSQLRLTFTTITETQMLSILTHYQGQKGAFISFPIPSAIWSGVNNVSDYELTSYGWRYIEPPNVTDAMCANAYDVELTLETVPPEGTAVAGLDFLVLTTLNPGVGVALNQTELTIAASLTPGVAGAPGLIASITWSLAAGTSTGGAVVNGFNATVLAFVYSLDVANGLSQNIGVTLTPGTGSGTGGGDPDFANVSLLLHMDGSNGSTTFTDSSSNGIMVTPNGNAQISTSNPKFGSGTGIFDGTGDYLSTPSSALFNFSGTSFTVECWIRPANTTQNGRGIFSQRIAAVFAPLEVRAASNGSITWLIANANINSWAAFNASVSGVITASNWHHLAIVGDGLNLKVYVDGTSRLSTAQPAWSSANRTMYIGAGGDGAFEGRIDEVRITKGIARYTANFTPPTAPFPDS